MDTSDDDEATFKATALAEIRAIQENIRDLKRRLAWTTDHLDVALKAEEKYPVFKEERVSDKWRAKLKELQDMLAAEDVKLLSMEVMSGVAAPVDSKPMDTAWRDQLSRVVREAEAPGGDIKILSRRLSKQSYREPYEASVTAAAYLPDTGLEFHEKVDIDNIGNPDIYPSWGTKAQWEGMRPRRPWLSYHTEKDTVVFGPEFLYPVRVAWNNGGRQTVERERDEALAFPYAAPPTDLQETAYEWSYPERHGRSFTDLAATLREKLHYKICINAPCWRRLLDDTVFDIIMTKRLIGLYYGQTIPMWLAEELKILTYATFEQTIREHWYRIDSEDFMRGERRAREKRLFKGLDPELFYYDTMFERWVSKKTGYPI